jgi:ribosome modulation factor
MRSSQIGELRGRTGPLAKAPGADLLERARLRGSLVGNAGQSHPAAKASLAKPQIEWSNGNVWA